MRTPLLAIPVLAACSSSSPSQASFAGASGAQLDRAFATAIQVDSSSALSFAEEEATTPSTGCPAVEFDGNHGKVTGGCQTDGTDWQWDGTIDFDNSGSDVNVDFADFRFHGSVDGLPLDLGYDGTIGVIGADTGASQLDSHVTVTRDGVASDTDGDVAIDLPATYTADGTSITVDGLGTATVDGTWTLSNTPAGTVTLHGADDMVIDFSRYDDAESCAPYAIGDRAGTACWRVATPPLTNP